MSSNRLLKFKSFKGNSKHYNYLFLITSFFLMNVNLLKAQVPHVKARDHINITNWVFKKGVIYNANKNNHDVAAWERINVPHTYSMDAINDIGYYRGQAWYKTNVVIPKSMDEKRIFIRFEGVGQEAEVYVNEKKAGKHIGGYSAFCFDITTLVKYKEENNITVKVTNEPNFKRIPTNDKLFNPYGGIYRPVQIFATSKCAISPLHYASSGVFVELKDLKDDIASVQLRTHLSNISENRTSEISYKIINAKKEVVLNHTRTINLLAKDSVIVEEFTIKKPELWHGKINPHLYAVKVSLKSDTGNDEVTQTFGLRHYKIDKEKGFVLNDSPYRLYGVCMHQEWKQFGPALLEEHHQKDMALVDEIGATTLRLSHYQHSDITYQLADEKGILVWSEIPFVYDYSGREGVNAKQQLRELILQNYNHPSVYLWGLWNEVRAYESPKEASVILTKELKKIAHELDATRLTASASDRGMKSNMGNITDLQAWNKYFGWYYGEYQDMADWIDDANEKHPEIRLGISEYGIGGNIYHQDITKLEKPSGNYFPEPEQTKYHEITWEIIKARPFVWSSFVWNMFDFSVAGWNRGGIPNLNHKGLITYDRKVKKDAFYFYKANWSKQAVLYIAERRNKDRERLIQNIKVYSNLSDITLFANGKKITSVKKVSDNKIINFKNIELSKGMNTIKVVSKHKKYSDKVVWNIL